MVTTTPPSFKKKFTEGNARKCTVSCAFCTHVDVLRTVPSKYKGFCAKLGPCGKSRYFTWAIGIYKEKYSLQNRRDFLRILGEQRRKRGEREARVSCEGRNA